MIIYFRFTLYKKNTLAAMTVQGGFAHLLKNRIGKGDIDFNLIPESEGDFGFNFMPKFQ